jgi:hypothetical protein
MSSNGGVLRPGSPARQLPTVLRALAAARPRPDAVRLELATVTAIPDADSVELDFGAGTAVVPRIAGYTPTVGEPAWCLAGETVLLAIGAVGGAGTAALPARLATGSSVNEIAGNYNLANESGWWTGRPDDANGPPAGDAVAVAVAAHTPDWIVQDAYSFDGARAWRRGCYAGGWSAWIQTWPLDETTLPARLAGPGRGSSSAAPGNDLNQATLDGWYQVLAPGGAGNTANAPILVWGVCHVSNLDTTTGVQIVYEVTGLRSWRRRWAGGTGGTWTAWIQLTDSDGFIVDGVLPNRLRMLGSANSVSDFNAANVNGWFTIGPGAANRPPRNSGYDYWIVSVAAWDTAQIHQYAAELWGELIFRRRCQNGTWANWVQLSPDVAVDQTYRRAIGGIVDGTLDGSGTIRVNFPRPVANVAAITVTNSGTGQLNRLYSAIGYDVNGFTIAGWELNNTPSANGQVQAAWIALVDTA